MTRAATQITQLVNEKDELPANGGPWGEGDEPGTVSGRALQVRVAVMDGYGLHSDDAIDAIRAILHGFVSSKSRGAFALPASTGRSAGRLSPALVSAVPGWGGVPEPGRKMQA
jgi:WHG domain-containing protein